MKNKLNTHNLIYKTARLLTNDVGGEELKAEIDRMMDQEPDQYKLTGVQDMALFLAMIDTLEMMYLSNMKAFHSVDWEAIRDVFARMMNTQPSLENVTWVKTTVESMDDISQCAFHMLAKTAERFTASNANVTAQISMN